MLILKRIYAICVVLLILATLVAVLLIGGFAPTASTLPQPLGYEDKLFAQERIHSIDIFIEDWEGFLQAGTDGQYAACSVIINKEQFDNVGIRIEEDASSGVLDEMGSNRYSLVLEFDHYNSDRSYHGLDKLNLDNLYQDNTMMKEFLTYQMMNAMSVPAPLCSYTKVYVNKKALGLYLAVEGIDDSFLRRNYGEDYGQLYKPQEDLPLSDTILQHINAVGNINDAVDVDAVTRYSVVHNYVCSETGSDVSNYYLYEKDGILSVLPRDYGLAFGGFGNEDASTVINGSIHHSVADQPMLGWIFQSSKYVWLYDRYYMELLKVKTEDLAERTAKMLRFYIYRDPSKFCTFEEFEAAVATLQQFLELRTESVQQQLAGKPANTDAENLDLSVMGGITTQQASK